VHLILILAAFFACLYYVMEQWEYLDYKRSFKPENFGPIYLPEVHVETKKRWVLCAIGVCATTLILGVMGRVFFLAIFAFVLWGIYCWHMVKLTFHLIREKRQLAKY